MLRPPPKLSDPVFQKEPEGHRAGVTQGLESGQGPGPFTSGLLSPVTFHFEISVPPFSKQG